MTCEVKYNEGVIRIFFRKKKRKKKKVESELLQANRSWSAGLREMTYRAPLQPQTRTWDILPCAWFPLWGWKVGDPICDRSEILCWTPFSFLRRQPCEKQAKQSKWSYCFLLQHRSPSQPGYDGGGGGSGGGAERARGQNCLFQKISHHLIFYRKAGGKAVSQQVKTGFSYHPKVPRTVRLRWVSLFYLPKRKEIEPIFARE